MKIVGELTESFDQASKWNDLIPLTPRGYRLTKAKVKLYVHRMMRTLKAEIFPLTRSCPDPAAQLREWFNVIFQELKALITKVKVSDLVMGVVGVFSFCSADCVSLHRIPMIS